MKENIDLENPDDLDVKEFTVFVSLPSTYSNA